MEERPALDARLDAAAFRGYYYLKAELIAFCMREGLSAAGGKIELTDRIAHYLETGERRAALPPKRPRAAAGALAEDAPIEPDFVCTERHRAFFRERIGKGFTFNVAFQKWLKANAGKTYGQAVEAYHAIRAARKQSGTAIERQFEYNTYIRDFFADNRGRALDEAIRCWRYKKGRKGHNRYERADLAALDQTRP